VLSSIKSIELVLSNLKMLSAKTAVVSLQDDDSSENAGTLFNTFVPYTIHLMSAPK
jgi:hypothetical protein